MFKNIALYAVCLFLYFRKMLPICFYLPPLIYGHTNDIFSNAQVTYFYFKLINVFATKFLKIYFITICDNYQENENKKK